MARKTIKYLLDSEAERLNFILDKFYKTNERDCLMIALAVHTGARAQELLDLTLRDFDFVDRSVYVRESKKGLPRDIPLTKDLNRKLKSFSKGMRVGDRLFDIGYSRLREIWHMYRPVKKGFHSIRHAAAIRLYKKTLNIQIVKYMLGHKSLSSTQIYIDYVYSQSELRKAFGVR